MGRLRGEEMSESIWQVGWSLRMVKEKKKKRVKAGRAVVTMVRNPNCMQV